MKFRLLFAAVPALLLVSTAMAQTAPPSDSWSTHPAASSTTFSSSSSSAQGTKSKDHFKFKDRSTMGPASEPPPGANDKAAVMGTDRQWQDGRPPVDCAATPHDSKCQ